MNDLTLKTSGLPLTGSRSYDSALAKINAEAELTPDGLRKYFQSLRDRGLAVATINHKIAAVKKSLKIMAERSGADSWRARYEMDRIFEENDLKRIKVETVINPDDCLTVKEMKKILLHSDIRTGILIKTLYHTATRISELVGMRYIDCDIDKKNVSIQVIGKGRKLRTVFITYDLLEFIRHNWYGKTYLFETRTGKALDRSNAWRLISRAGHDAGIKRLHPHTFRHTWATHNLKRLGIHKVSKYLGHVDISTTSKFYIHVSATADEILEQGRLF